MGKNRVLLSAYISENNQQEAIKGFLDLLNRKPEDSLSIDGLLELIGFFFNADRTYIFEQNELGSIIRNTFEWCRPGVTPEIANLQKIPIEVIDIWKSHFRKNGSFYAVLDEKFKEEDPVVYDLLKPQDIKNIIVAPLVLGGEIVGLFGIDNPSKHEDFLLLVDVISSSLFKEVLSIREAEKSKIAEKKFKEAIEMAHTANNAKSNFLFNMSHDIRTPLNAIVGYSELIKKDIDTKESVLSYLEKIEQSSDFLLSLINDVLDMARIESGKATLDENCININENFDIVVSVFETEAKKRGLTFKSVIQFEHNFVLCDNTKIRQVTSNLLSNALKYTPAGGTVSFSFKELPCDKEGYINSQIIVQDTGIGINEKFLPQLFDSFTREQNSTTSGIAGTGLGMAIVKKVLDLMGGTIEVESKVGEGTKFTVYLTLKLADQSYYQKKTNGILAQVNTDFVGKRILLAEDNEMNAEIAITILRDAGFVVERAEDGIDCIDMLNKAAANYYNLILMDIQMPHMDGYEATKTIRSMEERWKKNIPIVALTANAFSEDKKKAFDAGMNAHIAKPIRIKEMLSVIKEYL